MIILRGADEKPTKLLPRYLPFIAKNNNDVNARAGSKGELDFHDFLKVLVEDSEDWYCIHGIGKQMETWLKKGDFKYNELDLLLKFLKDSLNIEHGYDPDFLLINKNYCVFSIDSKNVTSESSQASYNKAINQGKLFKSLLVFLYPEYFKLPFYFGCYLPNLLINQKIKKGENEILINSVKIPKGLHILLEKEKIKDVRINEHIFTHLIKFLTGLKTKYDDDMVRKPIATIDNRLMSLTDSKIKSEEPLIDRCVVINGPAGSGKTYRIKQSIVKVLQLHDAFRTSILLCLASECATGAIKKEIEKELKKKSLCGGTKYYSPFNFGDWGSDLRLNCTFKEIVLNFLVPEYSVCVGKAANGELYYQFIAYKTSISGYFDKALLINLIEDSSSFFFEALHSGEENTKKCIWKMRDFTDNEYFHRHLEGICKNEILKIDIDLTTGTKVEKENFFQNSLFYLNPGDLDIVLSNFDRQTAFDSVSNIHLFVDDAMSSINNMTRPDYLKAGLTEDSTNKFKTVLLTFDTNQLNRFTKSTYGFWIYGFTIVNQRTVHRHSRKVYEYIRKFYEYSNYIQHTNETVSQNFECFGDLRHYVFNDLKRLKLIDIKKDSKQYIDEIFPLMETECEHYADGNVEEIEVEVKNLFKTVKKQIDTAITEGVKSRNVAIFVHFDFVPTQKQLKLMEGFSKHIEVSSKLRTADLNDGLMKNCKCDEYIIKQEHTRQLIVDLKGLKKLSR